MNDIFDILVSHNRPLKSTHSISQPRCYIFNRESEISSYQKIQLSLTEKDFCTASFFDISITIGTHCYFTLASGAHHSG